MLKYRFSKTKKIEEYLEELEVLKRVFETMPALPHFEKILRRESLLKSSLYSARIEGNPLTENEIALASSTQTKDIKKLEVFNLLKAYRFVYFGKTPKKLGITLIKKLHKLVMENISPNAGKLRNEPWGIFNSTGAAVYLAPAHFKLLDLMKDYVKTIDSLSYETPVSSAIAQFLFEKIHPFADGNGRVGRLISSYLLKNGGFSFRGLVSFEKYIDRNREVYYQVLEPSKNATGFVDFFLESIVSQANEFLEKLKNKKTESPQDSLLPRRREIYEIIKDHPHCSFNFISRRFFAVNPKTLHYDLLQLQKKGFVKKIGKTRGVIYAVNA